MKIEDKAYFAVSPAETKKQVALDIKKEMENLDKTIDKKAKELENTVWGEKWTGSPDLAKKENNKFKQLLDLKNQLQFLNSMLLGDGMSPELVKSSLKNSVSKIQKTAGFSMPVEDKAYFARRGFKARFEHNLTRKISLQESNSPTQVYKITEELYNKAALLKNKSLGYFELRTLIENALATGEAVKMSRTGTKSKFAATRIWPNDYGEINNANAKYDRLIFDRQKIIRANAGRRIKGEQPLEVPAPPTAPEFPFAFADGDYVGLVLGGQANVPKGATVKWAHHANSIKMSRTGTKTKFANRGAFAEASSSPVLGSLLEKKVMPEGGWRAVETDGGALVIAFEDGDIAGNFARRASENGYSATAPMAMAGRFWNVKVQNENKN